MSGAVATAGLLHHNTNKMLQDRAVGYVRHVGDLTLKSEIQLPARMEFVLLYDNKEVLRGLHEVHPEGCFDQQQLNRLLKVKPMLLPFKDRADGRGLHTVNSGVLRFFIGTLMDCLNHMQKGGFVATWKAFQIELACEEFFYGNPRGWYVLLDEFAASLGTSSTQINSRTYQRGALALAPFDAASVGRDPPPVQIWPAENRGQDAIRTTEKRVKRLFPLGDVLDSPDDAVVGQEMVVILMKDLYDGPYLRWGPCGTYDNNETLRPLRSREPPRGHWLVDVLDPAKYANKIVSHVGHFRYPTVFQRVVELVGERASECLAEGFRVLGLKHFPNINFRDAKGWKKAIWDGRSLVYLRSPGDPETNAMKHLTLKTQILEELVKRELCYERGPQTQTLREHGIPWQAEIEKRIPAAYGGTRRSELHIFCTVVGILQRCSYIDYSKLHGFMGKVPMTIAEMQRARMLSFDPLRATNGAQLIFGGVKMYKLHASLPTISTDADIPPRWQEDQTDCPEGEPLEGLNEVSEEQDLRVPRYTKSRQMPSNTSIRWSDQEKEAIPLDRNLTVDEAFKAYCKTCDERDLTKRSREALKKKRNSLLKKRN